MDHVEIRGPLSPADAAAAWVALFPSPGWYQVARLEDVVTKAGAAAGGEGDFDEWFLRRLFEVSVGRHRAAQIAIWNVLDRYLADRGVTAPSEADHWELGRLMFDLSQASTARMVGLTVPPGVSDRLTALGWSPVEILDFPALAYRMGGIYALLERTGPATPWQQVVNAAMSRPLSTAEQLAVGQARARAGTWLRPIFDDGGRVWTAERELAPLRARTAAAIAERTSARTAGRELANANRAVGIFRDGERVMRTEIAEHVGNGHWQDAAKDWPVEQLLYRPTSTTPCKVCLRLFKLPTGMPRLYTRAEVEAADALGLNTGPSKDWHVRIGAIHPHCVCGPWARWSETLRATFERRAADFAALMERLKVFKEAA